MRTEIDDVGLPVVATSPTLARNDSVSGVHQLVSEGDLGTVNWEPSRLRHPRWGRSVLDGSANALLCPLPSERIAAVARASFMHPIRP
jgi:hypothetical protein